MENNLKSVAKCLGSEANIQLRESGTYYLQTLCHKNVIQSATDKKKYATDRKQSTTNRNKFA